MELRILRIWITSFFCILSASSTNSENILFYWSCSGYSHRISVWPLITKLLEKGHSVSFISPYVSRTPAIHTHPNFTDIVPKNLAADIGLMDLDFVSLRLKEGVSAIDGLWEVYYQGGIRGCESLLKNADFLKWVNTSSFDLVILDALFNDCGYAVAYKFKAPYIMFTPTTYFSWFKDAYGLPDENYPEMELHYPLDMTFFQSVRNMLVPMYWNWRRHNELFPKLEPLLKVALQIPELPPLAEMEANTSLVLSNTHTSEEFPRSVPPNFVGIGGMHCTDERKPLPKDIDDYISSAENGFILLSFGTYASISTLPKYLQTHFFEGLGNVSDIKFLVTYKDEPPQYLPKNVKLFKWLPQQDILAHPQIKAFIGHGGLLGTQEAVFHGVPMITIPLFAEQDYNAVRAHERETAIALELRDLTSEKLSHAIRKITTNPKYKENTMRLSKLFRDRPIKPLDLGLYWIEYVMRQKDLKHLRPIGVKRTWYERRMLHIWAFLGIGFLLFTTLCILFIYVLCKHFASRVILQTNKSKRD